MRHILTLILTMAALAAGAATDRTVTLRLLETTDVHGALFPYDFIARRPMDGSLARVATYVAEARRDNPDGVILLDGGDILQGQPVSYFSNYIDTLSPNIAARCLSFLSYDAQAWGNHDVETGHACYDKWSRECRFPTLAANIYNTATGQRYARPYTIIERQGVRVAVIGLVTPAIPNWLPERLWRGLKFTPMVAEARQIVEQVRKTEKPDLIVGLFHSGREGGIATPDYTENASELIAREVPGFDIVMFGHDHQPYDKKLRSAAGADVALLNAGVAARNVAEAVVTLTKRGSRVTGKCIATRMVDVTRLEPDTAFLNAFNADMAKVKAWAEKPVGTTLATLTTRDAFFGPSAFIDLVHQLQLRITGADISITSPLTFDTTIPVGPITVADLFKLYKYENALYVMRLTGAEIRRHLEMSYAQWTRQMSTKDDHILNLDFSRQRPRFIFPTFDFDSAAGINYTVDVTKPAGQRVAITTMADGTPFSESREYRVALNSYRANGGGELLTKGAGIAKSDLDARVVKRYDRDLRHYLLDEIARQGTINPQPSGAWRFTPDDWVAPALARDRALLFPK